MKCKCDMRTKLVGDGCSECNPELYKEMLMDEIKELRQENDELKLLLSASKFVAETNERIILELEAQSLNHIIEQLGCSEQALLELKAQIAERQCPELAAQVEEETIESVLELLEYEVINADEEIIGRDWRPPAKEAVDLMYRYVKSGIKTMPRKYSNQLETAVKDGE